MDLTNIVLLIVLFYALTPGILVTLPENGTKNTVALVHAIIFTILLFVVIRYITKMPIA
jgi:hypothetical protein